MVRTSSNHFITVISIIDKIDNPNHGNSNGNIQKGTERREMATNQLFRPEKCNPLDRASLYRAASVLSRLRHKQVLTKFKQLVEAIPFRRLVTWLV